MIVSNSSDVGEWVAKRIFGLFHAGMVSIGLVKNNQIIAGTLYENFNGVSVVAHIAIDGQINRDFLYAIFHYPFIHLGANKVIAPVASGNAESRRLLEKMGFTAECELKDCHPSGSLYLYTMQHDQCRFIKERYGKRLS